MHSLLLKLKTKKYLPYIAGVFIILFIFIIIQQPAFAGVGGNIGSFLVSVLSWLFVAFINVMGNLLLLLINGLISIANYGDFMNAPIVEKGWVVIRDLGNIAIVFMLLVMAFSTLFKKGSYQYRDFLPKIVIAAILINFSKFITGLAISVSQVFMMEFVNAFKTIAAGNIVYGFGIHDLLAFRESASGGAFGSGAGIDVNDWSILGAVVLGALMVGIAVVIVLSLLVMLLVRILILWFLVMFSPVAFLGAILPSQISKYASKWQETLTKWLIAGPVVAFMLWLSFAVITEMTEEKRIINLSLRSAVSKGQTNAGEWQAFASKVSGTQNLVDYLVTAGLLMGALFIASQTGVAGAKLAGDAFGKIKGFGEKALSRGKKWGTGATKWTATRPLKAARWGISKTGDNIFADLAKDRIYADKKKRQAKVYNILRKIGADDKVFGRLADSKWSFMSEVGKRHNVEKEKALREKFTREAIKEIMKDPSFKNIDKTDDRLKDEIIRRVLEKMDEYNKKKSGQSNADSAGNKSKKSDNKSKEIGRAHV